MLTVVTINIRTYWCLAIYLYIQLPGSEVINFFQTQLSTKLQLLITTKIQTNKEVSCFMSLRGGIYQAYKC